MGNAGIGISVNSTSQDNTITGNTLQGHVSTSYYALDIAGDFNSVTGNTVNDNSGDGIRLNGEGNVISGNIVKGNVKGIEAISALNNNITGNTIDQNTNACTP